MTQQRDAAPVRLDSLTGLRFLAAGFVFVHHTFSSSIVSHGLARVPGTTRLAFAGMSGVTFFFVLSGFVLAWSWDPSRSYGGFLGRRLARVWPIHAFTFLLAAWVLLPVLGRAVTHPLDLLAGLLLVQSWSGHATTYFAGNGVSWSLSCELFFYALLPLLVPRAHRWAGTRSGLLAVLGCVTFLAAVPVFVWALDPGAELGVWVFPGYRVAEFVVGVVAGVAVSRGWRPPWSTRTAAITLLVAYVAAAEVLGGLFRDTHLDRRPLGNLSIDLVVLLPVSALVVAVAATDLTGQAGGLLRSRVAQRLGAASYAFYLVHSGIVLLVAKQPYGHRALHGLLATGLALVIAVVLADVLHHRVERPVEARLRARLRAREAARATAV